MSGGGPVLHVLRDRAGGSDLFGADRDVFGIAPSTDAVVDGVIGSGEVGGWAMTEEAVVYWLHRLHRDGVVQRISTGWCDFWALMGGASR